MLLSIAVFLLIYFIFFFEKKLGLNLKENAEARNLGVTTEITIARDPTSPLHFVKL